MHYSFKSEIAKKYGVNGAIIIENLYFWTLKNRANEKHFYDGYYWTYNSIKAFTVLFPFWTKRQIERILSRLEKDGAIKTGNYNKSTYDRTKWYAISHSVFSIYANGEMENTEYVNPNTHMVEPIPDNKHRYNTQIINTDNNDNVNLPWKDILIAWNDLPEPIKKIHAITELRKEKIKARINSLKINLDDILKAIKNISNCKFLQGENNRGWVIDFDWLFKDDTRFTKVLENKYQRTSNINTTSQYNGNVQAGLDLIEKYKKEENGGEPIW